MKVAFVAPFFGANAAGGAESECRNTALRLAASGVDVHVFTTCLLDVNHDWNVNYHARGVSDDEGITVHRSRVEYTDLGTFYRLNERLAAGDTLTALEERQFISMNVNSPELLQSVDAARDDFDWFCLIPYLFAPAHFAARVCGDKAALIPCLHDEPYARMEIMRDLFARVRRVVFHTEAEQLLAEGLYELPKEKGILLGEGIETGFESDAARFRRKYGIDAPFVLYAGRKDETKNVHTLIECFAAYKRGLKTSLKLPHLHLISPADLHQPLRALRLPRASRSGTHECSGCMECECKVHEDAAVSSMNDPAPSVGREADLKLVLIGPGSLPIPDDMQDEILDLGFVPDQDKKDAYSAASVFCQPSLNESFSIVIMEAWVCGTPCLVHAGCAVTREHVVKSGGGLYFETPAEFAGCLDYLVEHKDTAQRMGRAGATYVRSRFTWDHIIRRYREEVFA